MTLEEENKALKQKVIELYNEVHELKHQLATPFQLRRNISPIKKKPLENEVEPKVYISENGNVSVIPF